MKHIEWKSSPLRLTGHRTDLLIAGGIFALALAIRLIWVLNVKCVPISDFEVYDQAGLSVAAGRGLIVDGNPLHAFGPGYPAFLGTIYLILGHRLGAVHIANALLGALSTVLLYVIGGRIFNRRVGAIAGLLLAVYPEHVYFSSLIASENLFIPMLLGALLLYLIGQSKDDWRLIGLAGLALGATALVRPAAIMVPPAIVLWELLDVKRFRSVLIRLGIFGIALVIAIAPWTVRNYLEFGAFVPLSTSGGVSFWMGNNPGATGAFHYPEDNPLGRIGDPVKRDREGLRLGLQFIRSHPKQAAKLYSVKLQILYSQGSDAIMWIEKSLKGSILNNIGPKAILLENLAYLFVWTSALIGLALTKLKQRPVWFFILLFAAWSLLHPILLTARRYRLPMIPLMALFSAYAIFKISRLIADSIRMRRITFSA
ncbi:MAG: glycosyltransferase family 39 protein [Actinobacteria bacterium]|nr:glycosyltransferase family 39 protein [Actinomycetota bacterium]